MSLLARVGRLFNQMVAWFRPDAGASPPGRGERPAEPLPVLPPLWLKQMERLAAASPRKPSTPDLVPLLAMDIVPPARPRSPPEPPDEQAALDGIADRIAKVEEKVARLKDEPNRATRRQLEHNRRRHDKWVVPGGETPVFRPRGKRPRKPPLERPDTPTTSPSDDDLLNKEEYFARGSDVTIAEDDELILPEEIYGEFTFRDTILDQLDRYWIYLERMKRNDAAAYGFYKRVGATLVPADRWQKDDEEEVKKLVVGEDLEQYRREIYLPSWFLKKRPAFGCLVWGANPWDEARELKLSAAHKAHWWSPKFLYFRKYHRPPWDVQPTFGGDVYMMTVWWDRPHEPDYYKRKYGIPQEFGVHVSADGKVTPLKTRKHSDGTYGPWHDWRIPEDFESWARLYGLDARTHLSHLFCTAIRRHEYAEFSMVKVAVHKNDLTAVFGISPRRTSYFFQDRDVKLTVAGTKKPIFHSVRPHVRHNKSGTESPIKMGFRGLKEFEWAGYRVEITVPGRDHFMLDEVGTGVEEGPPKPGKAFLTEPQIGEFLVEQMHQGVGSRR